MSIDELPAGTLGPETEGWPTMATLILSALEAGAMPQANRRARGRVPYNARATLRLSGDAPGDEPRVLFTRDVNPHGLGFINVGQLPLGAAGVLRIAAPDGSMKDVECTVARSRVLWADWCDGGVTFRFEQREFATEQLGPVSSEPVLEPTLGRASDPPPKPPSRILIVDDDEQITRFIRLILEKEGHSCVTALTGAQGLDRFAREEPDLIITDLNMPIGDGVTLIESVRRSSDLPIVVISGFTSQYDPWVRGIHHVSILPKPVDIRALLGAVRNGLNGRVNASRDTRG